jgi:undecaprenyl-diphosphatase
VVFAAGGHLITYFQAIVIGLLQGVTELFPISSLGHAVILPKLVGWDLNQDKPYFLAFLVATHLATAIVLFLFFLPEWLRILRGLGRSIRDRQIAPGDPDARLAWLLVVGTIPAGLIGLLFEHKLRSLFASPTAAAAFLLVNGLLLFAAEFLRRRAPGAVERARDLERQSETKTSAEAEKRLATVGFREAVGVGTAQAAALFPGISRAGVTIGGGLFVGLTHEDAARYAFLLATPIIGAAALLKLPDLLGHNGDGVRGQALVGALCAGVAAWFAVKFLMRYFETNKLTPFAVYCVVAGLVALLVFVL